MIPIAVVGSTRPARRGESVARWVADAAAAHPTVTDGGAAVEVVDLATFDLPLLDELVPAAFANYARPTPETLWRFIGPPLAHGLRRSARFSWRISLSGR